jgi:hyperosmotically inducible periplasmic protein
LNPLHSVICFAGLFIALFAASGTTRALAQTEADSPQTSSHGVGTIDAKAAKAANRALGKVVIRQLSRTRGLNVDGINVVAVDGVVTLVGTVPDARQIDLATDVAKDVAGVREVHNGVTLQTNGK